MDILDFHNHSIKRQNKEYFVHLVRIAMADDIIRNNELEQLHRMGKKLGFTDPEIDNLIKTTGKSDYIPPYELSERFEQVYEIVKMTLVDGNIDKNEMRLTTGFAGKSGFNEKEIPRQGKDEEDLFEFYKKERKF
jgi:hypothetical protein